MHSLLSELKRRKVFRVAGVYTVSAWVVIQVVDIILPTFNAPQWLTQTIILLLLLGLPVAMALSWAFDLTPDGIKKTDSQPQAASTPLRMRDYLLSGLVVVLVAVILVQQFARLDGQAPAATVELNNLSIAVLPLANLSPDPDNDWFAAGVHEEILNQLVKVSDLQVTSRTTVLRYAASELSASDIARELNVGTILEGSVRFAGDQVRITTQLIRASDDVHLWSESYQREYADIFAIQSDVALQVANAMQATLSPNEVSSIERPLTTSTGAYTLYLQARYQQEQEGATFTSDPQGWLEVGIPKLERAVALDPDFAQGHAELGFYKYFKGSTGGITEDSPLFDEAIRDSNRAIALDPTITRSYITLSLIARLQHRLDDWEAYALQSVEMADPDGRAAFNFGQSLQLQGRYDEAEPWLAEAISKDPTLPFYRSRASLNALLLGDYEAAMQIADEFLAIGGSEDQYAIMRISILYLAGRIPEALSEFNSSSADLSASANARQSVLSVGGIIEYMRCEAGQEDTVREEIGTIAVESIRLLMSTYCALGIGDVDAAFESMRTALDRGYLGSAFTRMQLLDQAKQDPRWQELVDSIATFESRSL